MNAILIGLVLSGLLQGGCLKVSGGKIAARDFGLVIPAFSSAEPETVVSYAPVPGSRRVFTASEIMRTARRLGLQLEGTPLPTVCFERETAVLTASEIETSIRAVLGSACTSVDVLDFERAAVPRGTIEFGANGLTHAAGLGDTVFFWRGRIIFDGTTTIPIWAKVKLSMERDLVVAAEPLAKGSMILRSQLTTIHRSLSPFMTGVAGSIEEAEGHLVRYAVKAGEPVPLSALQKPREVSQGQLIRVTAGTGAALVSFSAKAQSGGRLGDMILIENPSNGRSFRARVTGTGIAEAQ